MSRKPKRRRIKIKYNQIFIICILIYITFNFINRVMASNIMLSTIEYGSIESGMKKQGIIIKDEEVLYSSMDGYINFLYDEYERVAKNSKVALINQSQAKSLVTKTRVNNKPAIGDIYFGGQSTQEKLYIIKNDIMNGDINLNGTDEEIISRLYDSDQSHQMRNISSSYGINAQKSGDLIFSADGYEKFYTFDNIENISAKDFERSEPYANVVAVDNANMRVGKGNPVGKIVNNHEWYVAFLYGLEEFENPKVNKRVNLQVGDVTLRAVLKHMKEDGDKLVLVFKVYDDRWKFQSFRNVEFKVVENRFTGIKIPKQAIVEVDSKQGVYILSDSGVARFKELKCILGENEDYMVLNYKRIRREQVNTVDLYDDVILNPENIEDGKKIR